MDDLDVIDNSLTKVVAALQHMKSLRGKPGYDLARQDWQNAVKEFEAAVLAFDEHTDA